MVRAEVGWALRASHDEYTVLSSGGPVPGSGDLAGVLSGLTSGAGREDVPSRVTFGGVHDGHQYHLGLVIQEWSREIDADGRPLSVSRYFALPYPVLSGGRATYLGLYHALRATELPESGGTVRIEPSGAPAEEQVLALERFGFGRVAPVAALLLDGSVTVTNADELPLDERLAFFDAVATLLPYGIRTWLTASTRHDDGGERIALAFSQQCRPGTVEADWRAPCLPPGSAHAAEYLKRLFEAAEKYPLTELVTYLASQAEPLAGQDPAEAVRILDDIDLPARLLHAARDGRFSYDALHKLFASGRFRELPSAEDRRYLFNELISRGNVDDLMVIEPLWAEADGDFEVLVRTARAKLWQLDPAQETARYLWSAERLGFADEFLARMVTRPDPEKSLEGAPGGEAVVAHLVRTRTKGEYTLTFDALADNGPVLYELLRQLATDPEANLEGWYEHLKRAVSAEILLPFFRVLRWDGPPVDASALSRLAARGPGCLTMLLRTAAAASRLEGVLPAFAALLVTGIPPGREFWMAELAALDPDDSTGWGMLDALLLALGHPPRHLEAAATAGDWASYQEAFEQIRAVPGLAAPIAAHLTAHLATWSWQSDTRQTGAALALASLHTDVPDLARVVLAARAMNPSLIEDERYAAWRRLALTRQPGLAAEEVALTLTGLRPDAEPEFVAKLCAEAIYRHTPLEEVLAHLTRSAWQLTGDRAVRLLNEIRGAFVLLGWTRQDAEEFALALGRAIVRTQDPALVEEIRARTSHGTLLEIEYQYQLLQNITMDPLDDEVLYLSDQTRKALTDLAEWVLALAKSSGRSRSWFG